MSLFKFGIFMGKSIQYNKEHLYTHTQCGHGNQHCMMTVSFTHQAIFLDRLTYHLKIKLKHESDSHLQFSMSTMSVPINALLLYIANFK